MHLQFSEEITSLAVVTVVEADVVAGDADAIVDADSIVVSQFHIYRPRLVLSCLVY